MSRALPFHRSVGIGFLAIEEVVQDVVAELYFPCGVYLLVSTGPVVV